jgi:predicted ATPase
MSLEHGFPQWLAWGRIFEAWIGAQGDRDGVDRIRRGIDEYRSTANVLWVPAFHGLVAGACLKRGATEEGLETIGEALALADATGARLWTPELHRLKGELLLTSRDAAPEAAEAAFREAIETSRGQGTRSWELRAVVSLSRVWERQGKREEARRLVAEPYGRFTEGLETPDLDEARQRIDELTRP